MTPNCEHATVSLWQDAQGDWWETFSFPEAVAGPTPPRLDNEIIRPSAATQTPAGEVLASRGLCQYPPPPPVAVAPPASPLLADTAAPASTGGGAVLLVLALVGSAGYAWWQQRRDRADFAGDYHPMSDVPALPIVYTDEDVDFIHERQKYPQYQGIAEPNPFYAQPIYPRSQPPSPAPVPTAVNQSAPVVQPVHEPAIAPAAAPVQSPGSAPKPGRAQFEQQALPAPAEGYHLEAASLHRKDVAYWLLWQAVQLGYSKNWCAQHLFKAAKGANAKYQTFSQLYDRVKGELA